MEFEFFLGEQQWVEVLKMPKLSQVQSILQSSSPRLENGGLKQVEDQYIDMYHNIHVWMLEKMGAFWNPEIWI